MSAPLPITVPSRTVLHYRNRAALALIQQRPPTRVTAELVRRVLVGDLDTLIFGADQCARRAGAADG